MHRKPSVHEGKVLQDNQTTTYQSTWSQCLVHAFPFRMLGIPRKGELSIFWSPDSTV